MEQKKLIDSQNLNNQDISIQKFTIKQDNKYAEDEDEQYELQMIRQNETTTKMLIQKNGEKQEWFTVLTDEIVAENKMFKRFENQEEVVDAIEEILELENCKESLTLSMINNHLVMKINIKFGKKLIPIQLEFKSQQEFDYEQHSITKFSSFFNASLNFLVLKMKKNLEEQMKKEFQQYKSKLKKELKQELKQELILNTGALKEIKNQIVKLGKKINEIDHKSNKRMNKKVQKQQSEQINQLKDEIQAISKRVKNNKEFFTTLDSQSNSTQNQLVKLSNEVQSTKQKYTTLDSQGNDMQIECKILLSFLNAQFWA